ncbi:MAG: hypothetical protein M1819_007118 [Sarea resinae]|nr:MAG: hypothetical protein M1819_007118 [Sarea resinae]
MPRGRRSVFRNAAHICLLALLVPLRADADVTSSLSGVTATTSTYSTPPTCPPGTINYITHSLPQQCLRSNWKAEQTPTTTTNAEPSSNITIIAEETSGSSSTQVEQAREGTTERTAGETQNAGSPSVTTTSAIDAPQETIPQSASPHPTALDPSSPSSETVPAEPESDSESPLDNANFLSFEEWKKRNMAKAEQALENSGQGGGRAPRRRPANIHNALDSLGEDSEIELDFGVFGGSNGPSDTEHSPGSQAWESHEDDGQQNAEAQEEAPPSARPWNKDAGTTCKERFNHASFDCAATILKTNPQSKGATSVLVENKDSYMLNECSASNKFIIVELCSEILIDTIVLADFEFFSSMFRTFRVSVSDRYPVKLDKWKELGIFEARNSREVQAFLVENPLIWARYLRIEFLTHYGNEYYCPVSLLRVHGTTMIEEVRRQEGTGRGDEVDDEEAAAEEEKFIPEAVAIERTIDEAKRAEAKIAKEKNEAGIAKEATKNIYAENAQFEAKRNLSDSSRDDPDLHHITPYARSASDQLQNVLFSSNETHPVCPPSLSPEADASHRVPINQGATPQNTSQTNAGPAISSTTPISASASSTNSTASTTIPPESTSRSKATVKSSSNSTTIPTQSKVSQKTSHQSVQNSTRAASSSTSPAAANPTTQESFFKTIHKRLQLLEANATLSLQYIEEQSRNLRDAFMKVEKRQLAKTTTFLENLNSTVLTELRGFRQQYDQIWQSTVIELEHQREQSQREVVAVSARLSILADEVVFQKRMVIVQSIMILLCLALVIFSNGAAGSYLDLPIVQSVVSKPQNTLRLNIDSTPGSPDSAGPSSPTMPSRFTKTKGFFGRSNNSQRAYHSDASTDRPMSPAVEFSPPTPTSDGHASDTEPFESRSPGPAHSRDTSGPESPGFSTLGRTRSSPATPSGTRRHKTNPLSWDENEYLVSGLLRADGGSAERGGSGVRSSSPRRVSGVDIDSEREDGDNDYDRDDKFDDGYNNNNDDFGNDHTGGCDAEIAGSASEGEDSEDDEPREDD